MEDSIVSALLLKRASIFKSSFAVGSTVKFISMQGIAALATFAAQIHKQTVLVEKTISSIAATNLCPDLTPKMYSTPTMPELFDFIKDHRTQVLLCHERLRPMVDVSGRTSSSTWRLGWTTPAISPSWCGDIDSYEVCCECSNGATDGSAMMCKLQIYFLESQGAF